MQPFAKRIYIINWNDVYREEMHIDSVDDLCDFYIILGNKLAKAGLIPSDAEHWKEHLACFGKTEFYIPSDKLYFCVEFDNKARYIRIRRKYGYRYICAENISYCRKLGINLNCTIERMRHSYTEYYPRKENISLESLGEVKIVHTTGSYSLFSNGEVYFLFQKLPD